MVAQHRDSRASCKHPAGLRPGRKGTLRSCTSVYRCPMGLHMTLLRSNQGRPEENKVKNSDARREAEFCLISFLACPKRRADGIFWRGGWAGRDEPPPPRQKTQNKSEKGGTANADTRPQLPRGNAGPPAAGCKAPPPRRSRLRGAVYVTARRPPPPQPPPRCPPSSRSRHVRCPGTAR